MFSNELMLQWKCSRLLAAQRGGRGALIVMFRYLNERKGRPQTRFIAANCLPALASILVVRFTWLPKLVCPSASSWKKSGGNQG